MGLFAAVSAAIAWPLLAAAEYTVEELKRGQPYIGLKLAVEEDNLEVINGLLHEYIVVQKLDKDQLFSFHTNIFKYTDYTALHYACAIPDREGHIKALLEYGAGVDRMADTGVLPIHVAAHHGLSSAAKVLLEAGAQVRQVTRSGMTPATIAARDGELGFLRFLHDYSAEAQLTLRERDSNLVMGERGWAPIEYAVRAGKTDVIKFLTFEVGWGDVSTQDVVDAATERVADRRATEEYVKEMQDLGRPESAEFEAKQEAYLREQVRASSTEL